MLNIKTKGYLTIIGAMLFYSILGITHTMQSLDHYFISYFYYKNNKDKSLPIKIVNFDLIFSFSNFFLSIFILVGVLLEKFIKLHYLLFLSYLLKISSHYIIYYYPTLKMLNFHILVGNTVIGLCYLPIMKEIWKYFPEKKGFYTGISLSSLGLNRLIFKYLTDYIINPNNIPRIENNKEYYPREIHHNLETYMRYHLYEYIITSIISFFLIIPYESEEIKFKRKMSFNPQFHTTEKINVNRSYFKRQTYNLQKLQIHNLILENTKPSPDLNLEESLKEEEDSEDSLSISLDSKSQSNNSNEKKIDIDKNKKITLFTLLLSFPFLQLTFIFFFTNIFGTVELNTMRKFGEMNGLPQEYILKCSLIWKIANFISIPIWGYLFDSIKFKHLYTLILVLQIVISSMCYFVCTSKIGFLSYLLTSAIVNSANLTIYPCIFSKIFDDNYGSILFGLSYSIDNLIYIWRKLLNEILTNKIYFLTFYIIITSFSMIALIILCFFVERKYDQEEEEGMELDYINRKNQADDL